MKTAREWADHLPEPIKTQFIENCKPFEILESKYPSISTAIKASLYWAQSLQNHFYWEEIYYRALKGEFDKPLTEKQ